MPCLNANALSLLLHVAARERILIPLCKVRAWLEMHNSTGTALVLAVIGVLRHALSWAPADAHDPGLAMGLWGVRQQVREGPD